MNEVLARWNELDSSEAAKGILPCCGAKAWAEGLAGKRPFEDEAAVLITSDEIWRGLGTSDWLEAFESHPKIGESRAAAPTGGDSAAWSQQEQKSVVAAQDELKAELAKGNREYEEKFGFIFIVYATGKSAPEILEILKRRLQNDKEKELKEAVEEQRQITQLRLKKWLGI
ncbi:MAG TPA: 2-oxo-4-hydroxy-4-carboxy-5-ureidoimidazoline decarboxylase [Candidatus Acidoferrum sp.]|nr:2-oxo-4-hydroxy-4-carboxy-5-ureidoimidazoline decarboxylase [Candidatus Acidoferrum sp.]